ncbi:MAG: type IV pilus modification protein PilV [Neisseriaceae bacterium]|nr:type IV pilus modification protein PilV [Neisseriaceae bacterium]
MKTATTLFNRQQGSTLIEILVSMFILALGLMALIAMQTRTSIGIKEAENQTIIAQATENLAENMMTNPVLKLDSMTTKKDYEHYEVKKLDCKGSRTPVSPAGTVSGDAGRRALAAYHLADFRAMACTVLGIDGEVSIDVNENSTGTVASVGQFLHVTWKMGGSSDKTYTYDYPLDDNL